MSLDISMRPLPPLPKAARADSYTKAEALLICWKPEGKTHQTFKDQRDKLGYELGGYNFGVETFELEPPTPYRKLSRRLQDFVQHDNPDTLLIVYYGGHGAKNEDDQLIWLRDEPGFPSEIRGVPQVNWSALQALFLHECASPVLFLLDCCHAGASVHREQSSSTVVALGATGFHDIAPVRGTDSFTTFLTKALNQQRDDERDVDVAYLKTLISAMLNNSDMLTSRGVSRRVTPDYFPFSNRTVTLKVLPTREDLDNPKQGPSLRPLVSKEDEQYFRLGMAQRTKREPMRSIEFGVKQQPVDDWMYVYHGLRSNNIRLLCLHPAEEFTQKINGYFEDWNLQTKTPVREYTCISWVQDTGLPNQSRRSILRPKTVWSDRILIVGPSTSLPVHPNLILALQKVRRRKEAVFVWVDQLCINWNNLRESEVQGNLIPKIFQQASKVAVWLGEGDEDSTTAIQFIPDILNLNHIDTLVKEKNTPAKWLALINLIERPYFNRRWVFLELILAKHATLYCGNDTIDWGAFADAVIILGSRYDEILLLVRAAISSEFIRTLDSLVDPRSLAAYSIVEASREHFRRQSDGSSLATCDLETLVTRLPALQSARPEAVIHALLPLATDREQWKHGVEGSPLEVYQRFVMHCVQRSKSLDIICRPWAPKALPGVVRNSQYGVWAENETLPSWIRQVVHLPFGTGSRTGRKNGDVLVGQPNRNFYAAAGNSIASPIFGTVSESGKRELDGSMTVSGVEVGEISQLSASSQDGNLQAKWIEMLGWPSDSNDEDATWDTVPDHMWRTLVADRGPGGTSAPLWYHQACRHWLLEHGLEDDISTSLIRDRHHPSMALEYIQRVRSVIWNRCLFRTTDLRGRKLFGLGPSGAENGDKVCVFHGCSVPVVVRQVKHYCVLVGECFVYGIMDGEIMKIGEYANKVQEFLLQ